MRRKRDNGVKKTIGVKKTVGGSPLRGAVLLLLCLRILYSMKKLAIFAALAAVPIVIAVGFAIVRSGYPRPYRGIVEGSGLDEALVYAVMKAESGFREDAESRAGAVGIMQLMPATAEFVCMMNGRTFEPWRLKEGAYNAELGCLYLKYLFGRFGADGTVLAAYNAGEGTVSEWLNDGLYSEDGRTLQAIPYPETARYVKKVENFRKKYRFFYH